MQINSLKDLISPITIEDFFKSYWEKNYLILRRRDQNYLDGVLNEKDINDFLGRKDIYYPYMRLVKNGQVLPKVEYLKHPIEPGFEIVDIDKVFSIYNSGGTIIIQKGQLSIPKLNSFCESIEFDAGFAVNANLYVTQKNTPGFEPHYDTHDIFIMQIAGKKHWRLFDSFFNFPLSNQPINKADSNRYATVVPKHEVELEPGDIIYIPRGYVHDTHTSDSTSIHITLGIFPHIRIEVLRKVFERAEYNEEFRKFLPTKYTSHAERDFFCENFKAYLKNYVDSFSIEDLLESFESNFLAERFPNTKNRFLNSHLLENLKLDTNVCIAQNISYKVINNEDGKVSLKFYDKEMTFPSFIQSSLSSIINNRSLKVKEIDGGLDDKSKLLLTKKLLTEGFLTIQGEV